MESVKDVYDFTVCWEPFLLRPDMPADGAPKPPSQPGNPRVSARLKDAGTAVGIDFTGASDRYPNTLAAHVLLEYAKDFHGGKTQDNVAEKLFQAYFTDGVYPDAKLLVKIAEDVGLNKDEVKKLVKDKAKLEETKLKARSWAQQGVTGVPCFFINGVRTFSGAQDPDAFISIFKKVAEKFPAESREADK